MHRIEGFPCTGIFRPCVRLIREVADFESSSRARRARLSTFFGKSSIWLNKNYTFEGKVACGLSERLFLQEK